MSTKHVCSHATLPRPRGVTPHPHPRPVPAAAPDLDPIDWTPLADTALVAAEWALDRAAELVDDDPDNAAIVDRVRVFVHGWYAGVPVPLALEDLAYVMGLLYQRLGRDLGVPVDAIAASLINLEPFAAVLGVSRTDLWAMRRGMGSRAAVRHCPGAPGGRRVRDPYVHTCA